MTEHDSVHTSTFEHEHHHPYKSASLSQLFQESERHTSCNKPFLEHFAAKTTRKKLLGKQNDLVSTLQYIFSLHVRNKIWNTFRPISQVSIPSESSIDSY